MGSSPIVVVYFFFSSNFFILVFYKRVYFSYSSYRSASSDIKKKGIIHIFPFYFSSIPGYVACMTGLLLTSTATIFFNLIIESHRGRLFLFFFQLFYFSFFTRVYFFSYSSYRSASSDITKKSIIHIFPFYFSSIPGYVACMSGLLLTSTATIFFNLIILDLKRSTLRPYLVHPKTKKNSRFPITLNLAAHV